MKKLFQFLFCFVLILSFNQKLFAGNFESKVKKIADLYDSMEYEKCLKEINEVEQYKFSISKDELLEIYKYKAFIYILSDRKAMAEGVIKEIYEIEPNFTLSPSISPKLREPFAKIKKGLKKEEGSQTKIIEAKPVKTENQERITTIVSKEDNLSGKDNFFKKNILPISLVSAGIVLFVPGLIVRLNAASDAEEYRKSLFNAPKDELGNIIGITKEDAEKKQSDIDNKVIIGNSLISVGSLAIVGGVASYFIMDSMRNKDENRNKVSILITNNGFVLNKEFDF